MQIVIEIPKEVYKRFRHEYREVNLISKYTNNVILEAFCKGTPLPKGHGDLIDRSKIHKVIPAEEDNCTGMGMTLEEMDAYNEGIDAMYSRIKGARPIIEADKAESEG